MFSLHFSPWYLYVIIDYKVNMDNEYLSYSLLREFLWSKPHLIIGPPYYRAKTGISGVAVNTLFMPQGLLCSLLLQHSSLPAHLPYHSLKVTSSGNLMLKLQPNAKSRMFAMIILLSPGHFLCVIISNIIVYIYIHLMCISSNYTLSIMEAITFLWSYP